jgi:hypothetical protein
MQYDLLISSVAFIETDKAYTYYENQLLGLGDRSLKSLDKAYDKLSQTPQHYGFINSKKDLRNIRIKDFLFVIIFQIIYDKALVLRVFNTNRNPLSIKNL